MNDLRILIARLGWPATSARWWTMQELASRLGEDRTKAETESLLLQLMRSRKLEAEVIEVLFIFWMAVKTFDYSPSLALTKSILLPSVLSDLLVKSCGLSMQASYASLQKAPYDFEIPDDFNGVQGVDLPRIFRTSMSKLEEDSNFPFVRQMAFEWSMNHAIYPNKPYQGDLGHFMRPLGDGLVGQFSTRTALRAISAYLRTLAVAQHFWGMPKILVEEESLLALPIHPTLALLRSKRPNWFPSPTDFDGDTQAIQESLQTLISRVGAMHTGNELIAFNSPVVMSMERCVEVSLVQWSQTMNSDVEDCDLATHLASFWTHGQRLYSRAPNPLSTTTIITPPNLQDLINIKYKAWPLAGALDFDRIGYLQHDLYPFRLFLPTMPGADEIEITPHNENLQAKVKGQVIAELTYWTTGWGPVRPRSFGGNCGTALISRGATYRNGTQNESRPPSSFYLWKVRTLHRSNIYHEFNETIATGIIRSATTHAR